MRWRFLIPFVLLISVLLIGTIVYHNLEGWRYLDSAYFTVATVTTIGYGDFVPKTDTGKIFTMFFAFSGLGIVFYIISSVGRYMLRKQLRERLKADGKIKNERGIHRIKRK